MIIDMHMHEMRYSGDSFLRLENMVEIAKRRGLDGICITDHDSMGLKEFAAEYSEKTGFPIFVGIEFYSVQFWMHFVKNIILIWTHLLRIIQKRESRHRSL